MTLPHVKRSPCSATLGGASKLKDYRLVTICHVCRKSGREYVFLGKVEATSALQEAMGVVSLRCENGHTFRASQHDIIRES